MEIDKTEIEVKTYVEIEDGKHKGIITDFKRPINESGFDYVDIYIRLTDIKADSEIEIKAGFPLNISDISALGRFLKSSGLNFKQGDKLKLVDIKEHLIDKKITFMTKNEKTEAGKFARVLRDTIEFI